VARGEWAWERKELMKSTYTVEGRHPADDTSPSSVLTKWMSFSLVGMKDPESLNMDADVGIDVQLATRYSHS
jgi:hypothetical protein